VIAIKAWGCLLTALLFILAPVHAGSDDTNQREVGVEWIEDYSGTWLSNLQYTREDAESFYNALGNVGWTRRFSYGDALAWESDFEKPGVGGWDSSYIDTLDFAYFSGHGSPTAFFFGTAHDGDGSHTYRVHYTEAEWGDQDLEWIVISACEVLKYSDTAGDVFDRWGWGVFRGLHMILGYDTISYDRVMGGRFVSYMTSGMKIKDAWIQTNIDLQPSDVYSAYLRVCENDDYLPGYGSVGSDYDSPTCLAWRRVQS